MSVVVDREKILELCRCIISNIPEGDLIINFRTKIAFVGKMSVFCNNLSERPGNNNLRKKTKASCQTTLLWVVFSAVMPPKSRPQGPADSGSGSRSKRRRVLDKGSEEYLIRRERNNVAVKKSREKSRAKAKGQ